MAGAGIGYSGKPLAAKLGISATTTVLAVDAPPEYEAWLDPLPVSCRTSA